MANGTYRLLIVEDLPEQTWMIRNMITEENRGGFEMKDACSLTNALAMLEAESYDAVLLDLGLPDSQGMETLRRVKEKVPATAIVVLTGQDDEEAGMMAVGRGAQDYLVKIKVSPEMLVRSLRYAIMRMRVEKSLRDSQEELSAIFEASPVSILLVDREYRVRKVNRHALRELAIPQSGDDMKCGEILQCVHALRDSKGCGATPHCKSCKIRQTVTDIFETGKSHSQLPAVLTQLSRNRTKEVNLSLTSVPVNIYSRRMALLFLDDKDARHAGTA
jgi:two-component system, cell cycle sensor histidine kinase and response regulator CckA